MSPNSLKQFSNGDGYCHYDQDLADKLLQTASTNGQAIKQLTEAIQTLTTYHKEMTRWLLIVVCVIALGAKLVEMAKDIWGHNRSHATAE